MTTAPQPPPAPTAQQAAAAAAAPALAGAVIATALATATTVGGAAEVLVGEKALMGVHRLALRGALAVVMSLPPDRLGATGPATLAMIRLNMLRRGQFAFTAARRLTQDLAAARSNRVSPLTALHDGIERERRYFGQHVEAMYQRTQAGARADSAAAAYGPVIGWYTVRDSRTSRECLAMDGRNFLVTAPPPIGLPGGVHPHCRCFPGKPYPAARLAGNGARPVQRLARDGLAA